MVSWGRECGRFQEMPKGLIFLLIMIAVIVVYTIARVIELMRKSEEQWEEVDKSKLKEWDDDDDW
jgi:hypothetical protein